MKPQSKYYPMIHAVRNLAPGDAYVAQKGVDFDCQPESFRGVVYDLAATKGGGWRGTSTVVRDLVIYAFYRETDYMRPNLPAYPIVKKYRGEQ